MVRVPDIAAEDDTSHLVTLEEISRFVDEAEDLQGCLNSIAGIVAKRMQTEVCSVYLLDAESRRLTLSATKGLDPVAVGHVSMTMPARDWPGLVVETREPVMVMDAPSHPRFLYFPETGEERYHSFFGVPVNAQRAPIGVLVVQTSRPREFTQDEVRLLKAISAQVSTTIVNARLVDSLKDKERERKQSRQRMVNALRRLRSYEGRGKERTSEPPRKFRSRLTGLAACPGFAYGKAHIMHRLHGPGRHRARPGPPSHKSKSSVFVPPGATRHRPGGRYQDPNDSPHLRRGGRHIRRAPAAAEATRSCGTRSKSLDPREEQLTAYYAVSSVFRGAYADRQRSRRSAT